VKYAALLLVFALAACGGGALTPATIQAALSSAGASNYSETKAPNAVPQSYIGHAKFVLADKSGQYFLCDTKRNCDAIFAYFDAFKALAGPYTYQSGSGLVVVQLNSELTPAQAAPIEQATKNL